MVALLLLCSDPKSSLWQLLMQQLQAEGRGPLMDPSLHFFLIFYIIIHAFFMALLCVSAISVPTVRPITSAFALCNLPPLQTPPHPKCFLNLFIYF